MTNLFVPGMWLTAGRMDEIVERGGTDVDDVLMWIGPYLHLVQYPVRSGKLYNQVIVFKSFRYKEGSDDWGTPDEIEEHFGECCEAVRHAVFSYISGQRRWPMYDRNPMENWSSGRVTLLGDAAHPMLQYLAQGGCQAIEDAAYLTNMLHKHGNNIEQAFLSYKQERFPRSSRVQLTARLWGEIIHANDNISILLRNELLKNRNSDDYSYVDWLYAKRY